MRSYSFSFNHHHYRFTPKIGFFFFCLIFLILFYSLGQWQLYRYHTKKHLVTLHEQRMKESPKPLTDLIHQTSQLSDLEFQSVAVQGKFLNDQTLLIQNKMMHGELGVEVITPFQLTNSSTLLLVDRGWLPNHLAAHIPSVNQPQRLTGYLKLVNEHQFILGNSILTPHSSPTIIQKIDIPAISALLHQDIYPYVLRLNEKEASGFEREWVISSMPPERHLAYAIQWFAFDFIVLIGYVFFCCERLYAN